MGALNSTESEKRKLNLENDIKKWLQSPDDRFFINIRAPNLIQVVDAPRDILQHLIKCLDSMAKCVRPVWRANTYEIELFDSPFFEHPKLIESRNQNWIEIVFCRFFSNLYLQNWQTYATLNLSPFCDRSTCYFRKASTLSTIETNHTISVAFSTPFTIDVMSDRDACLDQVTALIQKSLTTTFEIFHLEIKETVLHLASDCVRILRSPFNLWKCVSIPDSNLNRRFLLEIVAQLENIGYRLSTSIDFRGNADTLFFTKIEKTNCDSTMTYCLLSANRWDILRLYEAPKDLLDVTRLLLNQHWPQGLESESTQTNWHEFQLSAFPWASRSSDTVQSHSMIACILQTYLARGWKPISSVQISRTFKDRSCIILRKEKPAYRPHMCLGLLDSNELHLINAEDDLRDYVIEMIASRSNMKKKSIRGTSTPCVTLRGDPWCSVSLANQTSTIEQHAGSDKNDKPDKYAYDYLEARAFIQKLICSLRVRGWEVVCNIDLAARVKYKRKSSNGGSISMQKVSLGGRRPSTANAVQGENTSMPLDVNSLILANVNGSRHNSFARSANDSLFAIRSQISIE